MDIVLGATSGDHPSQDDLIATVCKFQDEGTLYVGYPIIALEETKLKIDVLHTSKKYGLVAFDLSHYGAPIDQLEADASRHQATLFVALSSKMLEHSGLRKGRNLSFEPTIISLHSSETFTEPDGTKVSTFKNLKEQLPSVNLDDATYAHLNAFVQRSSTLRPKKKRANVTDESSKGALLKRIEREIANLDAHQKKAAIELPDGPQRIRGLAGSGKTIVLAQKAAYLHSIQPDWRIVMTFQTRSLYQQFSRLITQFTFESIKEEPDWDQLSLMHAWGGSAIAGVYAEICRQTGHTPLNFSEAKSRFGYQHAFEGACNELLHKSGTKVEPLYDAVLIDEAQDLPRSFFEICYLATKPPHRVVYAYDELQNLSDFEMLPPEDLFGNKPNTNIPRVRLTQSQGKPRRDIILPKCYRNPPWVLSTAHAMGFGVYRTRGLVQMFEETSLWPEIGYRSANGEIALGKHADIERDPNASPEFFQELLSVKDSLVVKKFSDRDKEYKWVLEQIKLALTKDELDPDDILIIIADPFSVRSEAAAILRLFAKEDIGVHLAGVMTSASEFFKPNSIPITSIYRAKGNEAPLVFVVGAEHCAGGLELSKKRNILFTAMTRSRGWLRVTGNGERMDAIVEEFESIKEQEFHLKFQYPNKEQLARIRTLHREREDDDLEMIDNDLDAFSRVLERLQKGDLEWDQIPPKLRKSLQSFLPNE